LIFTTTEIADVILIEPEPVVDERGHFARWYCSDEFAAQGLDFHQAQGGVSRNTRQGTLRGLHFSPEPDGEAKLVRCIAGSVFDVVVDLRPKSATYGRWIAKTLNAATYTALYIPRGCAHGFLTLESHVDVSYVFSKPFRPGVERGIRWDDPNLAVRWPANPVILSKRDRELPFLRDLKLMPKD
jgi:dTDP-4-dehydrorhamnose 3,5-epimerase